MGFIPTTMTKPFSNAFVSIKLRSAETFWRNHGDVQIEDAKHHNDLVLCHEQREGLPDASSTTALTDFDSQGLLHFRSLSLEFAFTFAFGLRFSSFAYPSSAPPTQNLSLTMLPRVSGREIFREMATDDKHFLFRSHAAE